ncbi:hypothetical protein BJ684DRAFT_20824 [Piptocephalis cylindrospora]|uniref:Ras family-domain-containing protein n=1 Tax=Piptocephalis cylindrospora TaxID=1907219 RepID=A0A4P9Y1D2_9FUNG|nr:hypothetical protein BJ684DRAFT_20824 [Piptocephalis cylindrospora]|eukprot:RKP12646.1 hypothetical protein BJ684DRAFT_20824 [Piptocephalis cylindrospora]
MSHEREVPREEAEEFARKNGIMFTEVSAKTSDQVDQCFLDTTARIHQLVASGTIPVDDVDSGVNQRTVASLAREDARRQCSC